MPDQVHRTFAILEKVAAPNARDPKAGSLQVLRANSMVRVYTAPHHGALCETLPTAPRSPLPPSAKAVLSARKRNKDDACP